MNRLHKKLINKYKSLSEGWKLTVAYTGVYGGIIFFLWLGSLINA